MRELFQDEIDHTGYRLVGDINGNGLIDDSGLLSAYLYNGLNLTPDQLRAADVNGDGIVDDKDLDMLSAVRDNWFARWIPIESSNPRIYMGQIDPATGKRGEALSYGDYRRPGLIMNQDGTFYLQGAQVQKVFENGTLIEKPYDSTVGFVDSEVSDSIDYTGLTPVPKLPQLDIFIELPDPPDPWALPDPINPPVEYPIYDGPIDMPVPYPDPINPPVVYPIDNGPINMPVPYPDPINPPVVVYPDPVDLPIEYGVPINPPVEYPIDDGPINMPVPYPDPINPPVVLPPEAVATDDFITKIQELLKNPLVLLGGGVLILMLLSNGK